MLSEQLRELEADGIVARTASGPVPMPVRYDLTDYGRTGLPLVESARVGGMQHLQRAHRDDGGAPSTLGCAGAIA